VQAMIFVRIRDSIPLFLISHEDLMLIKPDGKLRGVSEKGEDRRDLS
jgi:hypothetical protein